MKSIVVFSFMIKDLKLKGSELLIYALIYSFSQFDQVCFMKPDTMAKSLGLSRSQVFRAISSLSKRRLIGGCCAEGLFVISNDSVDKNLEDNLAEMIRIAKTPWLD